MTNPGLRTGGKIFAMLVGGELVVKLPAERCAELKSENARPFQVGKRAMREWVSIEPSRTQDWDALAPPLVRAGLWAVLVLCLLHWAHRFRYTLYDGLQVKHLDEVINLVCYGGALAGSLLAAYVLWNVPGLG